MEHLKIFEDISKASRDSNSTGRGDCSIRALASVLYGHYTYEYINQWAIDNKYRRLNKQGKVLDSTKHGAHIDFLKSHNIKYKHYYRQPFFAYHWLGKRNSEPDDKFDGKTIKGFQKEEYKGKYILTVRAHQLAVLDGRAIDWADNKQHRLLAITQVFI